MSSSLIVRTKAPVIQVIGAFFLRQFVGINSFSYLCSPVWKDARVAEEARLESVCTPKGYREFESRSFRKDCEKPGQACLIRAFLLIFAMPRRRRGEMWTPAGRTNLEKSEIVVPPFPSCPTRSGISLSPHQSVHAPREAEESLSRAKNTKIRQFF